MRSTLLRHRGFGEKFIFASWQAHLSLGVVQALKYERDEKSSQSNFGGSKDLLESGSKLSFACRKVSNSLSKSFCLTDLNQI